MDVTDYNVIYDYGNKAGPTSKFQAWVGLKVTEETATQVRFTAGQAVWACSGATFGGTIVTYSGFHGSGTVKLSGSGWYADTSWRDYGWVNRGTTITLTMTAYYTGGSGTKYSSTITSSYKVPSRTAHGTPTFTANLKEVGDGDAVTLTIKPSGTQGNAQFAYFQISDGMGNLFYTSPTSLNNPKTVTTTDVPSAVLAKYGAEEYLAGATGALGTFNPMRLNCVYYAAREVHEWYGTYPASDWVWIEVEVVYLNLTLYDAQGAAHKVVKITVYDENGNALSGDAVVYNKDGNQL